MSSKYSPEFIKEFFKFWKSQGVKFVDSETGEEIKSLKGGKNEINN